MQSEPIKAKTSISVIVPTYNRKKILKRALQAYKEQSLAQDQFEIIVIDDGSADGTMEMVEKLCETKQNIRYLRQEHCGPAKARNLGIENARSDIIMFTGDDCIPSNKLLEEHLRPHKKGDAIAVLGHIDWHPELKITPFMKFINLDTQFSYPKIKGLAKNVPFYYFYTSNISIPKKYFDGGLKFDEEFKNAVMEDVKLGYRIWKRGVRIVYNRRAITYHHHRVSIEDYVQRQIKAGQAASILYRKQPELIDFLRVPKVTSSEVRARFYQAALDYYYFVGLQQGIEADKKKTNLIPFKKLLKNWSSIEQDQLIKRILSLEKHLSGSEKARQFLASQIRKLNREMAKRGAEIAKRDREIAKRDKLIEELHNKNQEKFYRIVELEKFSDRVKASLAYRIRSILKRFFRSGASS